MKKKVYTFGEGSKKMRSLLGGKGANLSEMTNLGLPVPPGFIISTEACNEYYQAGKVLPEDLKNEIFSQLKKLEKGTEKSFGGGMPNLLLSVRSGAAVSMPGMMDTILNLGLNDITVLQLARHTSPFFAFDCYRRLIQMFGNVVFEVPQSHFEAEWRRTTKGDTIPGRELSIQALTALIDSYKKVIKSFSGEEFPQDPLAQLFGAIEAVFQSWQNERAKVYRQLKNISEDLGTAVTIQSMVFGNLGDNSGTGVCFTRNPSNGKKELFGEFLMSAQGEDVVAGTHTPLPISEMKAIMPEVYTKLTNTCDILERHYRDMQDIEFTVENGQLFLLQTRAGKRTGQASIKMVIDMVDEELITKEQALLNLDETQMNQLLHPSFDGAALKREIAIATGLAACPGVAVGKVLFDPQKAVEAVNRGHRVILARMETSPDDINGVMVAEGVLTARGGMTSHAAVVARGLGKCCITGCEDMEIDDKENTMTINGRKIVEGDYLSLEGSTGKVYKGLIPTVSSNITQEFKTILDWADKYSRLKVLANAETPEDTKKAVQFGAKGIGLCRTEHMFFQEGRINTVRRMILAEDEKERSEAIERLYEFQFDDFKELFFITGDYPVNIRLLDPPLHEFLPNSKSEILSLAEDIGLTFEGIKKTLDDLRDTNPMLGHRGCRLGITIPKLYKMQVRAIVSAALEVKRLKGNTPRPEIMIPLVSLESELRLLRLMIIEIINDLDPVGELGDIPIGTMVEVPRACIISDRIALYADYFSYGTNDLTQMTYGFSRDDSDKFLRKYHEEKILDVDPFQTLDERGVGHLVELSKKLGRKVNGNLKLGLCGEHGGDPKSIEYSHKIGLDYVSCSPFRVPVARIAAAKAAVKSSPVIDQLGVNVNDEM